jgi:hypothetical protein
VLPDIGVLPCGGATASPTTIVIKDGEKWFGGAVNDAHLMPFKDGYSLNMYGDTRGNQAAPLLVSTKGRFIWSEEPFKFSFSGGKLVISDAKAALVIDSTATNLRGAAARAAQRFFPAKGILPDTLLFTRPQYNTWIELTYNQNRADVLKYARAIVDNGFSAGCVDD